MVDLLKSGKVDQQPNIRSRTEHVFDNRTLVWSSNKRSDPAHTHHTDGPYRKHCSRTICRYVVEAGDCLAWWSGCFADEWFALSDVAAFFGCCVAVDAVHVVGLVE